jgi:surfactin synthase thioesterase subunit
MNNIGIVFIHGAGLNGSIWDELIKEIDIPTLAIDFPNRKTDRNSNNKLTFNDYANITTDQIKNWKKDSFIIVAHSIGACVGLKVANYFRFDMPNTKRLYIKLTNDKSMPTALQDRMAKNLNANKIVSLDSGHLPMKSKPKQLAIILSDFTNDILITGKTMNH